MGTASGYCRPYILEYSWKFLNILEYFLFFWIFVNILEYSCSGYNGIHKRTDGGGQVDIASGYCKPYINHINLSLIHDNILTFFMKRNCPYLPFSLSTMGDNSLLSWKTLKTPVHLFCVLILFSLIGIYRFPIIYELVRTLEMFSSVIKRLPLGIDVCGSEEKLHHELFKRSRCTSACINCINCILPPIEFEIF